MENVKMYEPMNFAVDVWDGIVETKTYAVYENDGVSYSVIDMMGNPERLYHSKVVSVEPCDMDKDIVKGVKQLCAAMAERAKMDREFRQRKKASDEMIAERKYNLSIATGLLTTEQFEQLLGVELDKKYGGDMSVKIASFFGNSATVNIVDARLVRKYPTVEEFSFLSHNYGDRKYRANHEDKRCAEFATQYAPAEKAELANMAAVTVVGADINKANELVAYRRYTIKFENGLCRDSIDEIVNAAATVVAL